MRRRDFLQLSALSLAATRLRAQVQSGQMQPVLKRGYDNSNSGANLKETVFTQANVAAQGIKKIFSLPMEGDARGCEAQPLIIPSVAVDDGTTRDLCIACSMNGLVYAFDANDSDIIWVKKLSVPVNGSKAIDAWGINDHWSILSTPVIDAATNRLYAVAWTSANGNAATAYYQMHVLNLKDGSRVCPPVPIEGTSNGQTWNKIMRKQRSSLLMTNVGGKKTVFFGCGTVSETAAGAAGWVIAFDCASNFISATLAISSGDGAGIWMGGSSLCADSGGYLYAVTGNGGFDGVADFGEAVVKIQYTGSALKVVDWWSPYSDSGREGGSVTGLVSLRQNRAKIAGTNASTAGMPVNAGHMAMAANQDSGWWDEDLGSGGPLLMPQYNALLACGKDSVGYVVNTANMGKTKPADFSNAAANYAKLISPPIWLGWFPGYGVNAAPQDPTQLDVLWGGRTRHMHSAPVFFQSAVHGSMIFVAGENAPVRAWSFNGKALTYLAQGTEIASLGVTQPPGGMPGSEMTLCANGSVAGTAVLIVTMPYLDANKIVSPGRLLLYDAENFLPGGALKVLWDSQTWNIQFTYNKFCPPVVSGGKIFVNTYSDQIDVYSLA